MPSDLDDQRRRDQGMAVRRAVLGDAHRFDIHLQGAQETPFLAL